MRGGQFGNEETHGTEQMIVAALRLYRKIGLLIDDSAGARRRVARQLYGADDLPAWWVHVRSAVCGARAIDCLLEQLADEKIAYYAMGVVVIDRYLIAACEHWSGPKGRPWDDPEWWEDGELTPAIDDDGWRQRATKVAWRMMNDAVTRLRLYEENRPSERLYVDFVTSYPPNQQSVGGSGSTIPWRSRGVEELVSLRPRMAQEAEALLRFGPGVDNAAKPGSVVDPLGGAVKAVREALHKRSRLILVTGAELASRSGELQVGLPDPRALFERACRKLMLPVAGARLGASHGAPGFEHRHVADPAAECACQEPPLTPPLGYFGGVIQAEHCDVLQYLEKLRPVSLPCTTAVRDRLDAKEGIARDGELRRLRSACVRILKQCDQRYSYSHWLLAHFAWDFVVGFDLGHFHERARQAVEAGTRAESPADEDGWQRQQTQMIRPFSFAPDAPPDAPPESAIDRTARHLRAALGDDREATMVILGDLGEDVPLEAALARLGGRLTGCHIIRVRSDFPAEGSRLRIRVPREVHVTTVNATILEFAWELWAGCGPIVRPERATSRPATKRLLTASGAVSTLMNHPIDRYMEAKDKEARLRRGDQTFLYKLVGLAGLTDPCAWVSKKNFDDLNPTRVRRLILAFDHAIAQMSAEERSRLQEAVMAERTRLRQALEGQFRISALESETPKGREGRDYPLAEQLLTICGKGDVPKRLKPGFPSYALMLDSRLVE